MKLIEFEERVKNIVSETSGCGFYLTINEKESTINIPKTGIVLKGSLEKVFKDYIKEVVENRVKSGKAKKTYRYE